MPQSTRLKCSRRKAYFVVLLIALLFILIGCAAFLQKTGVPPLEAAEVESEFRKDLSSAVTEAVAEIATAVAEGQDLKTAAIRTTTSMIWKIATAGASVLGVALSSLLGKWLKTERKITKTLIAGVESNDSKSTKEAIRLKAVDAGIQNVLRKRVASLT